MGFVSVDTRIADCDICGHELDDLFDVDELVVCGYCIPLIDMLMEFMRRGGTEEIWYMRQDGQMMMEL